MSLEGTETDLMADPKRNDALKFLEDDLKKTSTHEEIKEDYKRSQSGANELLNSKNIELKTELNPIEIVAASRLLFISDRYHMPAFERFIGNLLRLKVSNMRQGRHEYIDGLHAEERKEQGRDVSPILSLLQRKVEP